MVGTMDTPILYTKLVTGNAELWGKRADGSHDQRVAYTDAAGKLGLNVITAELGLPRDAEGKWAMV